jgi:fibrillin 1
MRLVINHKNTCLNILLDDRRGFCYLDVRQQRRSGRCSKMIANDVTRATCCCSIGRGWGESNGFCDLCPRNGTGMYVFDVFSLNWF